jgi:predicted metalloprotease with PDZ domain
LVAALIVDLYLLKQSDGKHRLNHVLADMYQLTYLQQKGYTKELYKELLEKWSGQNMDWYFQDMIEGKGKMTKHLEAAIAWIGCELCFAENEQGLLNCELKIKENQSAAENLLFKNWLNLTA